MTADERTGLTKSGYVVVGSATVAVALPVVGGRSYLPLAGLVFSIGVVTLAIAMRRDGGEADDEDDGGDRRRREKEIEAFEDGFA
jgi:hypothetical protein